MKFILVSLAKAAKLVHFYQIVKCIMNNELEVETRVWLFQLVHQFLFDKAHIKDNSFFANIVVDVSADKCDQAFAYVPDLGSYSLIVYNLKTDKSFRVQHHFFYMDPLSGNYNVGGVNFQWTDGIFSLALAPTAKDGSRTVFFHPLSSTMEFTVNSRTLQNETAANSDYYAYKVHTGRWVA